MNEQIEEILCGSYDLNVHAAPDGSRKSRMDALEVARCAYEAVMGGFVLNSNDYNTAPLTYALNQMYPGLNVFGAIALNRSMGGINPDAVQVAADLGTQVVWMPTHSADFQMQGRGAKGIRVANDEGKLFEGVHEVLEIIAAHDMTLASGHISPSEAITLFEQAKTHGVQRMIATLMDCAATLEEQHRMITLGAYPEYRFLSCMPVQARITPTQMVEAIRGLGVGNCIVTTDFWAVAESTARRGDANGNRGTAGCGNDF